MATIVWSMKDIETARIIAGKTRRPRSRELLDMVVAPSGQPTTNDATVGPAVGVVAWAAWAGAVSNVPTTARLTATSPAAAKYGGVRRGPGCRGASIRGSSVRAFPGGALERKFYGLGRGQHPL
jgi:hypothetical protein